MILMLIFIFSSLIFTQAQKTSDADVFAAVCILVGGFFLLCLLYNWTKPKQSETKANSSPKATPSPIREMQHKTAPRPSKPISTLISTSTQQPVRNAETNAARRRAVSPHSLSQAQVDNEKRIFDDSLAIVSSTEKIDVFLRRYDILVEKATLLDALFHKGLLSSAINNYPLFLKLCIDKEIEAALLLKTVKGRNNRIHKVIEQIRSAAVFSDQSGFALSEAVAHLEDCLEGKLAVPPYDINHETQTNGLVSCVTVTNPSGSSAHSLSLLTDPSEIIAAMGSKEFSVHPDLAGMLWFSDGPHKNINLRSSEAVISPHFRINTSWQREPSAISLSHPISEPTQDEIVPKLPYYPSYEKLLPTQRWKYLEMLSNPYNPELEIGYIFVLYYGLERSLITGDFERAYQVILKLRDVHKNSSFQGYSADALVISSLILEKHDQLMRFLYDMVLKHQATAAPLLVIAKLLNEGLLSADDLMYTSRSFGFTNTRYIKSEPQVFRDELQAILDTLYPSTGEMDIRKYLNVGAIGTAKLLFANSSFQQTSAAIPNLFTFAPFVEEGKTLLQEAHDSVKTKLREERSRT